jgi:4-amino-4-deoxy-L-arabinose transferase-like glycosyltransferase
VTGASLRPAILIAAAMAVMLGSLGSRMPLWERDEPRFALAARSVVDDGAWHTPRVLGVARHQKPPLTSWLMGLGLAALGPVPVALRLPSALAAALAVLATWCLVAARDDPRIATWAAICLATSPLLWVEGLAATADAVLLACTTMYLALLLPRPDATPRARHVVAATVLSMAAWLAKSAAALVPAVALGLALAHASSKRGRSYTLAVSAFTTIAGAGALALWITTSPDGELARLHLTREIALRAAVGLDGHALRWWATPPFYAAVVLVGAAPWSLLLLAAPEEAARALRHKPACLAIIAAPVMVCLVVRTALPHYLLGAWPGLAWLAATLIVTIGPDRAVTIGRRAAVLVAVATAGELALLAWVARQPWRPAEAAGLPVLAALLVTLAASAAVPLWRGRLAVGSVVLAAGTTAALGWTAGAIAPPIAAAQVSVRAAVALTGLVHAGDVVCLSPRTEAGVAAHGPAFAAWRRAAGDAEACRFYVALPDELPNGPWEPAAIVDGLDVVHGRASRLLILRRRGVDDVR